MEKWYECISCKKMTKGLPATLRNKCLMCRNIELESRYRQQKYEQLTKKELQAEHRRLMEKLKGDVEEHHESDSISEQDDDSNDPEFVPETPPVKSVKQKLYQTKVESTKKRKIERRKNESVTSETGEEIESKVAQEKDHQEEISNRKKHKKRELPNICTDDSDDSYEESDRKYPFQKYIKFDNHYLPGQEFKYTFVDNNLNKTKKKRLQKKINHRLRAIKEEYKELTGRKTIHMQGRKKSYHALLVAAPLKE